MKNVKGQTGSQGVQKEIDPLILCSAFKKHRFYIFSRREPEDIQIQKSSNNNNNNNMNIMEKEQGRDVFNEKPNKEDQQIIQMKKNNLNLA
jgi:peptidylprolyl isomerase domain and WD repeat-containing protein 1